MQKTLGRRSFLRFRFSKTFSRFSFSATKSETRPKMHATAHAASRRRASELTGTRRGPAEARRGPAALISSKTCAILDENFGGPENFQIFSVRNSSENARNCARRVTPTSLRGRRDLQRSRRGQASSCRADFIENLRDFGRKFWRPRKFSKFFGPKLVRECTQIQTPRHANEPQSSQGPARVPPRPGVVRPR